MKYIVNLRAGMNDINALVNLDSIDKSLVLPFINTRGELKNDYLFNNFLINWGDFPFMVDASLIVSDMFDEYNQANGLLDHTNAFQHKYNFYDRIYLANNNLIPVISILQSSTMRDNIQFLLKLQNKPYRKIALRITDLSQNSISNLFALLATSNNTESIIVLYDIGSIVDANINSIQTQLSNFLQDISITYNGIDVSIISTSYPPQKTSTRDTWYVIPNLDLPLYFSLKNSFPKINLIYGDYGSTNPTSPMEYIPGMSIIPCVTYYDNCYWYQMKTGNSHEFNKFVDLANCIISEPFYHGYNFSWGDNQINDIAQKTAGNGNAGTWNGIRINQYITTIARMP